MVVTARVVVAAVALGVTEGGVNVAAAPVGRPEMLKLTVPGKPPDPGVTVMVKLAGDPAGTVTELPGPATVKSSPVPVMVMVCVVVGDALSVRVSVAVPRAPTAPGVNVTLMMQVPAGATLEPFVQVVPVATAKSEALVPEIAGTAEKVRATPPGFVTVMVFAALAVPTP